MAFLNLNPVKFYPSTIHSYREDIFPPYLSCSFLEVDVLLKALCVA